MSVITANNSGRQSNSFATIDPVQGNDAVSFLSTKDSILVPCDSDGTNSVYTDANLQLSVFEGSTNATATWSLSITSLTSVTAHLSAQTLIVTNLSANAGNVIVRASKDGFSSLYKQINVYKLFKGEAVLPFDTSATYIAFADDINGNGYTTLYSQSKEYYAILFAVNPVVPLVQASFNGLWRPVNQYPITSNYDKAVFLHTEDCHWNINGMAYASMTPGAYHYKGTYNRIYFTLMDYHQNAGAVTRGTGHTGNSTKVGYYDLDNKCFSALVTIPNQASTSIDQHDIPTIIVSDDGHVLVIKEALTPGGVHNSNIEIWRSNSIEQIALEATPTVHDFTLVTELVGLYAYPNVMLGPNTGELFLFLRNHVGGDHGYLYASKSDDEGTTWSTPYAIASCVDILPGPDDWYFYPRVCLGRREDGINIVGSFNEGGVGDGGTSPDGFPVASTYKIDVYLYSPDGITFGNVQYKFNAAGQYSKDVVANGMLTPTQMLDHFVIKDVSTVAHHSIDIIDSAVDGDGVPYLFIREWERWAASATPDYTWKDNLIYADWLYYYNVDTNVWTGVDITGVTAEDYEVSAADFSKSSVRGSRSLMNVYKNGTIDYITRRVIVKPDFYKPPYSTIDNSAEALRGGLFKITTATGTPANNFGEGMTVGDYYYYLSTTPTFDANNTLTPLEEEIVFYRSKDKGATWTEIREPLYIRGFNYATYLPITASINNNQDHGVTGVFLGIPKPVAGGAAYDHSELVFVYDQVRV